MQYRQERDSDRAIKLELEAGDTRRMVCPDGGWGLLVGYIEGRGVPFRSVLLMRRRIMLHLIALYDALVSKSHFTARTDPTL